MTYVFVVDFSFVLSTFGDVIFCLLQPHETAALLFPIDTALHLEGNCPVAALQKISWTLLRGQIGSAPGVF